MASLFARILLLLVLGALSACMSLPKAELAAYSETYVNVKTAGDLILDEVSPIIPVAGAGAQRRQVCPVDPKTGFRPCFSVALALGDGPGDVAESVDIRIRRLALAVIVAYNQMLVDLAEGRSADIINARIDSVSELASSVALLVPAAGPVTAGLPFAVVKTAVTKLEGLRASQIGAASVVRAAPDIRALIQFLINDTPALYALYISQYNGDLGQAKIDLRRAQLRNNAAEVERLSRLVKNLQDPDSTANKARAFEKALTTYVQTLDQTDKAIVDLVDAITLSKLDTIERATVFVKRATEIRLLVEELEADLKALREAG